MVRRLRWAVLLLPATCNRGNHGVLGPWWLSDNDGAFTKHPCGAQAMLRPGWWQGGEAAEGAPGPAGDVRAAVLEAGMTGTGDVGDWMGLDSGAPGVGQASQRPAIHPLHPPPCLLPPAECPRFVAAAQSEGV